MDVLRCNQIVRELTKNNQQGRNKMEKKELKVKVLRKGRLHVSFDNITTDEARLLGFGNGIPRWGFSYSPFGNGDLVCDDEELSEVFEQISDVVFDRITIKNNKIQ